MKLKNFVLLLSLLIVIGMTSCDSSTTNNNDDLYTPTTSDATSIATLDELTQGRTLYIANCKECHSLYLPDSYSKTKWSSILDDMAPKTQLSSSEKTLVFKYVTRGK